MLKNTAKYTLIVSLILILQLAIVLLIVSENNPLYEWIYNPVLWQLIALPIALFLVSSAIGFIVALPARKKKAAPADEVQARKKKKVHLFWSAQFFANLLLSLIVVGFAIPPSPQACFPTVAQDTAIIITLMLAGILAASLAIAALITAAVSTWQTNKATSYILGLTTAIPIAAVIFGAFMVYSYSTEEVIVENNLESYYREGVEEVYTEEEEEYYETVENDAETLLQDEESEAMSNVVKYFIHARMSLTNNQSDVFSTLQRWMFVVNEGQDFDYENFYFYNTDEWDSRQTFMQAAQDFSTIQTYLTGDSNELLSAFQRYFPHIKSNFQKSDYKNSIAAVLVKSLLATHDDLYADSNTSSDRLQGIYNAMSENDMEEDVTDYYPLILPYTDDVIKKKHILADNDNEWLTQQVSVWAYSFWARRYQEGTDEAALTILNMITNYYKAN